MYSQQQIEMMRQQGMSDEQIMSMAQNEQPGPIVEGEAPAQAPAPQGNLPQSNVPVDMQQQPAPQPNVPETNVTPDPRIMQIESNVREAKGKRSRNDFSWGISPATDSEAIGEGLFAFGLKMLASSSRPGANFGEGLAEGLAAGSERFMGALNRNKRYENIEKLQEMGYNDPSINDWLLGGDNKTLSKAEVKDDKIFNVNNVAYRYDPVTQKAVPLTEGPSEADKHIANAKVVNGVLVAYDPASRSWKPVYGTPNQGKGSGSGTGSGSGKKGSSPKGFDQVWINPETDEPVYYKWSVDEYGDDVRIPANPKEVIGDNGVHLPYDKYATTYAEKSKGRTELISSAKDLYEKSNTAQYTAQNLLNDPALSSITGQIDTRTFTFFDAASNAEVQLASLGGQTFLTAFERLKGGGQITEIEGKQAKDALLAVFNADGTLKPSVTADALRKALTAYDQTMQYSKAIAEVEESGKSATIKQRKEIFNNIFVKPGQDKADTKVKRGAEWDKEVNLEKEEAKYKGPAKGQPGFVPPSFRGEWEYMTRRGTKILGRRHGSDELVEVPQ